MDIEKIKPGQDPSRSRDGEAPPDPSNTSHIGQPIEQGVIKKKEGISEQSAEWENSQEKGNADKSLFGGKAEKLSKKSVP